MGCWLWLSPAELPWISSSMKGRLCRVRAFIRHGGTAFLISVLAMSHQDVPKASKPQGDDYSISIVPQQKNIQRVACVCVDIVFQRMRC